MPWARLHRAVGSLLHSLGHDSEAIRSMWTAARISEAIGWWEHAEACALLTGEWAIGTGDYRLALEALRARLRSMEARAAPDGIPGALNDVAVACSYLSDVRGAASAWERAERLLAASGDDYLRGVILGNLAGVHASLGRYALAERQLAEARRLLAGLSPGAAGVPDVRNLVIARAMLELVAGSVYLGEGRASEAKSPLVAASLLAAEAEEVGLRIACEANLTIVLSELGVLKDAIQRWRALLVQLESDGRSAPWAQACGNLADALRRTGELQESRERYEQALDVAARLGGPQLVVDLEGDLGRVLTGLGMTDDAIVRHTRALEGAKALEYGPGVLWQWIGLCEAYAAKGDLARALECARSGMSAAEASLASLPDVSLVGARARFGDLFRWALVAAARAHDPEAAFEFLKESRGAGLWRALSNAGDAGSRGRVAAAEEERLRGVEARAWKTLFVAIADPTVPDARVLELRSIATEAERAARVEAERKEAARAAARPAVVAAPESLADAVRALPQDAALVAYAAAGPDAFALVVTQAGGGRLVPLPPSTEGLARGLPSGPPSAADIEDLAKRFVAPLALPSTIRRVLVSPSAETQGVPFPALFGDRQVLLVPFVGRGSVSKESSQGKAEARIVALVDPAVDAAPLGGARAEGRAVGDVLLEGKDATESAARAWLAGEHGEFEAILFGCHVRVDPADPYRSHLLLAADAAEDGKLTARELLGIRIVPGVRLVVLSACESAVGKNFEGEGLIGLHRAFMLAGAPRVLASLWKVDDAATARFMIAFFDAWNPRDPTTRMPTGKGVSAAEALRLAQKVVREDVAHPEWKDPKYWAAWVLWGLPE